MEINIKFDEMFIVAIVLIIFISVVTIFIVSRMTA